MTNIKSLLRKSFVSGFVLTFCASSLIYGDGTSQQELKKQYNFASTSPSDIFEHLPVLRQLASESNSVIEIGMRGMVSSWALLQGLSENDLDVRFYLGIDIATPPIESLTLAQYLAQENGIDFAFWEENDMSIDIPYTDFLFIDSLHTYCHLTYELEKFSPNVNQYIAMHDTSAPWGTVDDSSYNGNYSEYPAFIDRNKRGLWPAVEDFLARHPEWTLHERRFNNHGLTVLKRVAID